MPIIPLLSASKPLPDVPAPVLDHLARPTVNLSGVQQGVADLAKASRMPLLPESLAEPYSALGSVGKAVSESGSVLGALAQKMRQAETDSQVHQNETKIQQTYGDFQTWVEEHPEIPPSQRQAEFDQRLGKLREEIGGDKTLHPAAREQIAQRLDGFQVRASNEVGLQAAKDTFAQARSAYLANYQQAVAAGNDDQARAVAHEAYAKAYTFPHEHEHQLEEITQARAQRDRQARAAAARADLDSAKADALTRPLEWLGDPKNREPWPGREGVWRAARTAATQRAREGTGDVANQLQDFIASETFTVPAEIEAFVADHPLATPALRERAYRDLQAHNLAAERREQQAHGRENYLELYPRVMNYDPTQDADGAGYYDLRQEVRRRIGQEDSGFLRDLLYRRRTGASAELKPGREVSGWIDGRLESLFDPENGLLPWRRQVPRFESNGDPALDAEGRPQYRAVIDPAARAQAADAMWRMRQSFHEWMATTPRAALTIEAAKKKLEEFKPQGTEAAALHAILQRYQRPALGGSSGSLGNQNSAADPLLDLLHAAAARASQGSHATPGHEASLDASSNPDSTSRSTPGPRPGRASTTHLSSANRQALEDLARHPRPTGEMRDLPDPDPAAEEEAPSVLPPLPSE